MVHGAGALLSSALDGQALELMLGGQMIALEALKAQALTLCSTPCLIIEAITMSVHRSQVQCKDAGLSTYVQRSR